MAKKYPWYFAWNDKPVMVIKTEDGGMDVLRLNALTGEFERDLDALDAYFRRAPEVDALTEEEFNALVKEHRDRIAEQ